MCNDETMVLEADFSRDDIVDDDESIDAKRTTENDDLTTENDASSDKEDTRGINEEIDEETKLTSKTKTVSSESTEKTMEIATTKKLNEIDDLKTKNNAGSDENEMKGNDEEIKEEDEQTTETMTNLNKSADKKPEIKTVQALTEKQKKINEKLIERAMVIAQRQDMNDLRGVAGEIKEETEFTTETETSLSESTEMTMEITTTKSLNEKEKKVNEKTMETAMVIAQQKNMIFGKGILSNYGQESTKMVATVDANVEDVFYSMNEESKTRVKVRWKVESILVSELTKLMRMGYYWKLLFLFRMWLMWKGVYWKYCECAKTCNRKGVRQSGVLSVCYSF